MSAVLLFPMEYVAEDHTIRAISGEVVATLDKRVAPGYGEAMAAASQMLAALQEIRETLALHWPRTTAYSAAERHAHRLAADAIAKAEGRALT